jgi:hypothetical protein
MNAQCEAAPFMLGYYVENRIHVHEFESLDAAIEAALGRFADRCAWVAETDTGRILCGWAQVQALRPEPKW